MDKNLESRLVQLASYKVKDSLLNAIYDIAENPKTDYMTPKRIEEIYNRVCRVYADLGDAIEKSDRNEYIAELDAVEAEIKRTALDLNRYIFVNDNIGEQLIREYKLKDIMKADTDIPLNNRGVVHTAEHFLTHMSDSMEDRFKEAEIIASLPLRMTRERYASYVKDSILLMTEDMPAEFTAACIERLKDMYYALPNEGLKADFPLIYEKLMLLYEEDNAKLSTEEIEERLGDLDSNAEAVNDIFEILGIYYNDISYLRIAAMFAADSDFIFEDDMMLKDLYYALRDSINSKDTSFNEEIMERAADEIEKRFEVTKPFENDIMKEIQVLGDNEIKAVDEGIHLALSVNASITDMFYKELGDILMEVKTNKDKAELIDSLVEYIGTASVPSALQKFTKQRFLRHIPCPMSHEEITEYISYALDGINDRYTSLMAYGDMFRLTEHEHHEHEHGHHEHEHHEHHEHHLEHHEHCDCGHHH